MGQEQPPPQEYGPLLWWPLSFPRTDTVLLVARELSQVPKAAMVEPLCLPSNLLSLFCRYVDKETVNRLDVKLE